MGLGYHEIATGTNFGLARENMDLGPRGLVVLPKAGRVIASGAKNGYAPAPGAVSNAEAKLLVFDLDMKEVERIRPLADQALDDAGAIWKAPGDARFFGCVPNPKTGKSLLYLYDLAAHKIVKSVELADGVALLQRPADGTWWAFSGATFSSLDPASLELKPVGQLARLIHYPVWSGKELYGTVGGELVRVAVP